MPQLTVVGAANTPFQCSAFDVIREEAPRAATAKKTHYVYMYTNKYVSLVCLTYLTASEASSTFTAAEVRSDGEPLSAVRVSRRASRAALGTTTSSSPAAAVWLACLQSFLGAGSA